MAEAKEGCAWLEDVDKDTFTRFAQYLYTGTYKGADTSAQSGLTDSTRPDDEIDKVYGYFDRVNQQLWPIFQQRKYTVPSIKGDFKKTENSDDYTEIFLCHARLYAFADKYDITLLKNICLASLHQDLVLYTSLCRRPAIVELLRYTYSNTPGCPNSMDDLRSLVIHQASCVVKELALSIEFTALLGEMGGIGRDIVLQLFRTEV